jgi:hypothetical protein
MNRSRFQWWLLRIATAAMMAWVLVMICRGRADKPLSTRMIPLELPRNAEELRCALRLGDPRERAQRDLFERLVSLDDVFLWLYPLQLAAAALFVGVPGRKRLAGMTAMVIVIAGVCDHFENRFLHAILISPTELATLAAQVKTASLAKWTAWAVACLLMGVLLMKTDAPRFTGAWRTVVSLALILAGFVGLWGCLLAVLGSLSAYFLLNVAMALYAALPLASLRSLGPAESSPR